MGGYRYEIPDSIKARLREFAHANKDLPSREFARSWQFWVKQNGKILSRALEELQESGYAGDPLDKLQKAARYYYSRPRPAKQETKTRRTRVPLGEEYVSECKNFIQVNACRPGFKPALGFEEFCNAKVDVCRREIFRLMSDGVDDSIIRPMLVKCFGNCYTRSKRSF